MKTDSIFSEITEWRRRGVEIRQRLMTERAGLVERLGQIDAALAELAEAIEQEAKGVNLEPPPANRGEMTAPELVLAVMKAHPVGLSGNQIVTEVRGLRPIDPVLIHSAIYRLKNSKRIQASGQRGARMYRLMVHTRRLSPRSLGTPQASFEARVQAHIENNPGKLYSVPALAEELHAKEKIRYLFAVLSRLQAAGKIERPEKGRYRARSRKEVPATTTAA